MPGMNRFAKTRTALAVVTTCLAAGSAQAAADLSNLLTILESSADGEWSKVSLNAFSDAWPAVEDRALSGGSFANPAAVTVAWSSFAWDSLRGDLILFGGGHANYAGNEVYRWRGTTQLWELASLPSQVTEVQPGIYTAADGAMNAPPSMHTYDHTNYLPVADRYMVLGGAIFNSGGMPVAVNPDGSLRTTGPYLWDPAKADGTKVGGTTGSAVDPTVLGGNMWSNRDTRQSTVLGNVGSADGTSATTVENGKDVVYFTGPAGGGTDKWLYKYTINDVQDPQQDTVALVGVYLGGPTAYGAAGYDPDSGYYVSLAATSDPKFVVWNTRPSVAANINVPQIITPTFTNFTSFISGAGAGIDYDPVLDAFLIWDGAGSVWQLDEPTTGGIGGQWSLTLLTDGSQLGAAFRPDNMNASGVRGKWHYIPNLNAFMALEGNASGEVWLYRPTGWVNPVPEPEAAWLLSAGLLTLGAVWRARRKSANAVA